jgi:hypothetical protein
MKRPPQGWGQALIEAWKLPVRQARFARDGKFYMPLYEFPAALCDPDGYVIFRSRDEYDMCQQLNIGSRINVRGGISSLQEYVRFVAPPSGREPSE